MKITIQTTLFIMLMYFCSIGVSALAEEVILCINEEENYVDMVNEKDVCAENESQFVINRSDMGEKKAFTPLANFKENADCSGDGSRTEIGFDENENGSLDQNEIVSISGVCNPEIAEITD